MKTASFDSFRSFIEHQLHPSSSIPTTRPRPFVTLSRQAGSGGTSVSQKLAERLQDSELGDGGWVVFDKALVERVLQDHALPKRIADYLSEEKSAFIQSTIEECLGLHPPIKALLEGVARTILSVASMGNVILVGRGAHIVTSSMPHGFHVRLVGSVDTRLAHLAEMYSVSHGEASRVLKALDHGRKAYLKQHFGKDIDDPTLYHLVINTDLVSFDDAAAIIAEQVVRQAHSVSRTSHTAAHAS